MIQINIAILFEPQEGSKCLINCVSIEEKKSHFSSNCINKKDCFHKFKSSNNF